jgi:hypothetical protein
MNAQLLYATKTGHSERLANAIGRELEIPIHALEKFPKTPYGNGCCCGGVCAGMEDAPPAIPPCDILFIVCGIYGGKEKEELLNFARTLSPDEIGQVVLLISSARGKARGSLRSVLEQGGHRVAEEEYHCKGSFLVLSMGRPNAADLEGAVAFVKKWLPDGQ